MRALLTNDRGHLQRGFTLVELVATLILIGILAATVVPRFFGTHGFEERGFYDETIAALRYGQKSAIAQRRMVCVTFTEKAVRFKLAGSFGATDCTAADADLSSPDGTPSYAVDATANTKYRNADVKFSAIAVGASTFPASPAVTLNFYPSGASSAASTIQVANFSSAITVEAETGYVH